MIKYLLDEISRTIILYIPSCLILSFMFEWSNMLNFPQQNLMWKLICLSVTKICHVSYPVVCTHNIFSIIFSIVRRLWSMSNVLFIFFLCKHVVNKGYRTNIFEEKWSMGSHLWCLYVIYRHCNIHAIWYKYLYFVS